MPETFEQQESSVRRVFFAYQLRKRAALSGGGIRSMISNLSNPTHAEGFVSTTPSDTAAWLLSVEMVTKEFVTVVGSNAARIVERRVMSRSKSTEGSWREISVGVHLPSYEVKQIYALAMPLLARMFAARNITHSLHQSKPDVAAYGVAEREFASAVIAAVPDKIKPRCSQRAVRQHQRESRAIAS